MAPRACVESTCWERDWTDCSSGRSHPPLRVTQEEISRLLQSETRGVRMSAYASAGAVPLRPPMSVPGGVSLPMADESLIVTDSGIRMVTEGRFVLVSFGGTEGLGLACPKCEQLCLRLLPFARCQRCRAYLFVSQPPITSPREYRMDRMTGTLTEENWDCPPACPSVEIVEPTQSQPKNVEVLSVSSGLTLPTVTSASTVPCMSEKDICATSSTTAVTVWRANVGDQVEQALRGCGRGLPQKYTWFEWPRERSEKVSPYPPAEELHSSEVDSYTDEEEPLESMFETEFPESRGFRGSLRRSSSARRKSRKKRGVSASSGVGESNSLLSLPDPDPVLKPKAVPVAAPMPSIMRAADSAVLPGMGDPRVLSRVSRLQRIVFKEVESRFGFEYPYLPSLLLDQVDDQREGWCRAAVWDFLRVPVSERESPYAMVTSGDRLEACLREWSWGRTIYRDRVVIRNPNQEDRVFSIVSSEADGKLRRLPDPRYYR